ARCRSEDVSSRSETKNEGAAAKILSSVTFFAEKSSGDPSPQSVQNKTVRLQGNKSPFLL
ncbi:hypothetical protein, partial [Dialister invisus]|uniref:hypothetical protein n=1 Tax=Dialister invisus TaxID=218538 RepID=UPI003C6FF946